MTNRDRYDFDPDNKEFELELFVNQNLRQKFDGVNLNPGQKNERLVKLWQHNIRFIIGAMTNRRDRLSYRQIKNARIFDACGWDIQRIFEAISAMENREITVAQVQRLLAGETYQKIPFVLVNVDENDLPGVSADVVRGAGPVSVEQEDLPALSDDIDGEGAIVSSNVDQVDLSGGAHPDSLG